MFARYESAIAVASCHQLMNEMRRKGIYIVKIIHHLYWPNDLANRQYTETGSRYSLQTHAEKYG